VCKTIHLKEKIFYIFYGAHPVIPSRPDARAFNDSLPLLLVQAVWPPEPLLLQHSAVLPQHQDEAPDLPTCGDILYSIDQSGMAFK